MGALRDVRALLTSSTLRPRVYWSMSGVVLVLETLLCIAMIHFVPCT